MGQWYLRPETIADDPSRPVWPEPSDADRESLETLSRALSEGRAALLGVRRRADGSPAVALCAIGAGRSVTPLALMIVGDPFALLDPPSFCVTAEAALPVLASGACPECGSERIGTPQAVPGVVLGRVEEGRFVPSDETELDWNGAEVATSPLGTVLACARCGARWVYPDADEDPDADKASPAAGPFSAALGECLAILERLKGVIDDHLGASPDKVTWGHAADAGRILGHLRHAAFVAGVGEEPAA